MKNLVLAILSVISLISCSDAEKVKPNSVGDTSEVKQEKPMKPDRKDPVPQTITLQEVSRIAIVEAEQFISNGKIKGLDISAAHEIFKNAETAYANKDYKKAQKLAVSVRKQVEKLMNN